MKTIIQVTVNGELVESAVEANQTLLQFLREDLELTGTKHGCGLGDCGACTVILDGKPVNACLVLAVQANGRDVLTIEGLAENGKLHPIQQSFVDKGAIQMRVLYAGNDSVCKSLAR
jgi:carbon-monoxide dehydrogenase small subunit